MLYCTELDKNCDNITEEECNNGCCDSCLSCIVDNLELRLSDISEEFKSKIK